ncbi:hypothetical protein [Cryptosporangium sp. NPDC051539]|uniref:hypothetical protein n=1 Tax=Cryptosporangium sp. NPDC051539 TaxID=3363962 RepID=UPI003798E138
MTDAGVATAISRWCVAAVGPVFAYCASICLRASAVDSKDAPPDAMHRRQASTAERYRAFRSTCFPMARLTICGTEKTLTWVSRSP